MFVLALHLLAFRPVIRVSGCARSSQCSSGKAIRIIKKQNPPRPIAVTRVFSRHLRLFHGLSPAIGYSGEIDHNKNHWREPAIRGKNRQKNRAVNSRSHLLPKNPSVFIICEKQTGIQRFSVEVNGDEHSAVVRSASLLALTCSMRGDSPADYAIRVPAHDELTRRVTRQAEELLRLGRGFSCSVPLSPRENEVLLELLRNRVNKEIAVRLHISVRTVKFHVSALLAKFGVESRWDLIQKAGQILGVRAPADVPQPSPSPAAHEHPRAAEARDSAKPIRARAQSRVIPFHRASLPA